MDLSDPKHQVNQAPAWLAEADPAARPVDTPLSCPVCAAEVSLSSEPEAPCPGCGADLSPQQAALRLHGAALDNAQRALLAGRYREALGLLTGAVTLGPRGARFRLLKGLALLGAGRAAAAETVLRGTDIWERLRPATGDLFAAEERYRLGREQALRGDFPGARAAVLAGPAGGDGLVLLGLCALQEAEGDTAQVAFLAALRADPSNAHAASLLALYLQ